MKIVFFLFASFFQTQIHKHSRSLLYNCWRRIFEEGFSSSFVFYFFKKSLKKDGIRSWFFIGKYRRISSGCSSVFKVVHTSRGAEPWPNQPGTSSHSFLQWGKKIRHIYQVFTLVKNSEINWWDCQLWKYRKKELKTSLQ